MIMVGASAYPRIIDFARIRRVATRVGAPVVTDMAHIAGLVAAGVHPSPVPHSDFVTTTTHKTLRGPRAGWCCAASPTRRISTRSCFRACRAGRSCTSSRPRPSASRKLASRHSPTTSARSPLTPSGSPPVCREAGFRLVSGGTDNHLMLVDVFSRGIDGQGRRSRTRQSRHHRQQERHPVRSEPADDRQRHPARHTRRHHPRHARSGDGSDRRFIARALSRPGRRPRAGTIRVEVEKLCRMFPLYPERLR